MLVKRGSSSSLGRDDFKRTASTPEGAEPITLRAASSARQSSFAETSVAPSTPYADNEMEVGVGVSVLCYLVLSHTSVSDALNYNIRI